MSLCITCTLIELASSGMKCKCSFRKNAKIVLWTYEQCNIEPGDMGGNLNFEKNEKNEKV